MLRSLDASNFFQKLELNNNSWKVFGDEQQVIQMKNLSK